MNEEVVAPTIDEITQDPNAALREREIRVDASIYGTLDLLSQRNIFIQLSLIFNKTWQLWEYSRFSDHEVDGLFANIVKRYPGIGNFNCIVCAGICKHRGEVLPQAGKHRNAVLCDKEADPGSGEEGRD